MFIYPIYHQLLLLLLLLLQSALHPLVGFRPAQLSLSILSSKVLQSAVASGMSNPQLGGDIYYHNRRNISTIYIYIYIYITRLASKEIFSPTKQNTSGSRSG
jgi:hypothetical protein